MASRLLSLTGRQAQKLQRANMSAVVASKHGNREVVGYGFNGEPNYADRADFPMPAIRFKEATPDVLALREKEKGDWKKLSMEEKKAIYRASFCQTFSEMKAPTGHWKSVVGITLFVSSLSLWIYMGMKMFGKYLLLHYIIHLHF
jgi:cytochrome c oxidase subunit 4